MAVENALYTILTGNVALAALVSARVYPGVIPQNIALPALAYQVIATERDYHHGGQQNTAGPLVQITVEAASYSSAKSVAAAVRVALSGYRGTVGTTNSTEIRGVFLENEYDGYNLETDISTVRQDYRILWKEV
jgi:hypothetical protein